MMERASNIEFTFAAPEDADTILSLIHQLEHFISREDLLTNLQAYNNRKDYFLLVAKQQQSVIAFGEIHLMHFIHEGKPRARLSVFCVDENYRNQKVGAQFLEYIEQFCREKEVYRLEVSSNNRRIHAHRFYENNGYESASRIFFKRFS